MFIEILNYYISKHLSGAKASNLTNESLCLSSISNINALEEIIGDLEDYAKGTYK